MCSRLEVPEEPIDIKSAIKHVRKIYGDESNVKYDSLAVWAFNRLPAYLWRKWSAELKSMGYTWQKFLRVLRLRTDDMVAWALTESLDWNEFINRVVASLERYKGRR